MSAIWLAALLRPFDVAPHLNFMSSESYSAARALALLTQARFADFHQWAHESLEKDPSPGARVVRAARRAMDAATHTQGAEELMQLGFETSLPRSVLPAVAVVASTALAELDRHEAAIELLALADTRLRSGRTPEAWLGRALVQQQSAMRWREQGESGIEFAQTALDLVRKARGKDFRRFETNSGVAWTSARTVRGMCDEIDAAAHEHLINTDVRTQLRDWSKAVRRPAPEGWTRTSVDALHGFRKSTDEQFKHAMRSGERVLFARDLLEEGVYAAYLHCEFSGSLASAHGWRSTLAMVRTLRPGDNRRWSYGDAVRLFRQAQDRQRLDLILRHLRLEGPLDSIRDDASRLLSERAPQVLRVEDVTVLTSAAPLLGRTRSRQALDLILESMNSGTRTSRRTPLAERWERWMRAAVALGAECGRSSEIADRLLEGSTMIDPNDQLMVLGLSRAVRDLDWNKVNKKVTRRWRVWAADAAEQLRPIVELVPRGGPNQTKPRAGLRDLNSIADWLNDIIRGGERDPGGADDINSAVEVVDAEMRRVTDEARGGRYSARASASPADVAAGLISYAGVAGLWDSIISFLLEPAVIRDEKSAAMDRLAREAPPLPSGAAAALTVHTSELLREPGPTFFEKAVVPFPPALRLLTSYDLISPSAALLGVTELAASAAVEPRIEAARTLQMLLDKDPCPTWLEPVALQLSFDASAAVRGESGRVLAGLFGKQHGESQALVSRIQHLLQDDGLLVPVLTMRGLAEGGSSRTPAFQSTVLSLSESHVASNVRREAHALLRSGE